jgi:hypothetical protein
MNLQPRSAAANKGRSRINERRDTVREGETVVS